MTQIGTTIKTGKVFNNGKMMDGIAVCSVTDNTDNRMLYIDVFEDEIYLTDSKVIENKEENKKFIEEFDDKCLGLYEIEVEGWCSSDFNSTMVPNVVYFHAKTNKRLKKLIRECGNTHLKGSIKIHTFVEDDCPWSQSHILNMMCCGLRGAASRMIEEGCFNF